MYSSLQILAPHYCMQRAMSHNKVGPYVRLRKTGFHLWVLKPHQCPHLLRTSHGKNTHPV
jgi:hypothetical protein